MPSRCTSNDKTIGREKKSLKKGIGIGERLFLNKSHGFLARYLWRNKTADKSRSM